MPTSAAPAQVRTAAEASKAITRTAVYVVLYVVSSAVVQYLFTGLLPSYGVRVAEYSHYVQILLAVAFGYLIVFSVANVFYWSLRAKYDHPTAAAVRNVVRIVGMGALAAAIAGGVAGGAAGVALGGFLGIVIGFASQ